MGEIVDLSAGGAFIKLHDFIPAPNTIIRLSFVVPGNDQLRHECRALIVRRNGNGVGVMFDRRQDPELLLMASSGPAIKRRKPASSGRRPAAPTVAGNIAAAVD
jgi:hypothetical protein